MEKRAKTQHLNVRWHVAMRPGKRRKLNKRTYLGQLQEALERLKASVRAKGEHPFYETECCVVKLHRPA